MSWMLRYDLRSTPGIGTPHDILYRTAIEQCAWADQRGCTGFLLAEHHQSPDGYLPSPVALASAIAARTEHGRLLIVQTMQRDPFSVAEDIAVVDNISNGRTEPLLTVGYVPEEFAFHGARFENRVDDFTEKAATLIALLSGEEVRYRGREASLTPLPVQQPRPVIRFGGATHAGARRAARFADAFMPMVGDPALLATYREDCALLGHEPLAYPFPGRGLSVIVTEDSERTWASIAAQLRHDINAYAAWKRAEPTASPYHPVTADDKARAREFHSIVTPSECVRLAEAVPEPASMLLHPLVGGIPPEIGWRSLELFTERVLPELPGH